VLDDDHRVALVDQLV
jgi:hypothetical protein